MTLALPLRRLSLLLALAALNACSHPSPEESAAANDRQCRGYGFEAGSVRYTDCRTILDRRSALVASRPPGSGNPTGLPIYLRPPDLPSPREQGCMVVPINGQFYTNCP